MEYPGVFVETNRNPNKPNTLELVGKMESVF